MVKVKRSQAAHFRSVVFVCAAVMCWPGGQSVSWEHSLGVVAVGAFDSHSVSVHSEFALQTRLFVCVGLTDSYSPASHVVNAIHAVLVCVVSAMNVFDGQLEHVPAFSLSLPFRYCPKLHVVCGLHWNPLVVPVHAPWR
jgi:hypothetical protein